MANRGYSMRSKRLGSLIVLLMLMAAAFPMMGVALVSRDHIYIEDVWDESKVSEKGKPQKPPADPPGSDEPADKSHMAVVIGIADYKRGGDLEYTDDDAYDMYNYLLAMGYQKGSIKLLIDRAATSSKILAAIDWLDQYETSGSEVVFFYSGHGSQYRDSNLDESDLFDECIVSQDGYLITDDRLKLEFSTISSTKFGIVFDSCFSGGMNDLQGPGRVVVTACKEGELSYDGDSTMQNGVFTWYFLQELYTYDTLEQAYTNSYDNVHNWGTANNIEFHPQIFDQYTNDWDFTL
jgi:hypothetical protein